MAKIGFCPIVGGPCNRSEPEIKAQENTFFLAESFEPQRDRERREKAIEDTIKDALGEGFSPSSLRMADREPATPAIFCDICRMIQSSGYGIADISGSNSNVLIEVGMMLSLGKPVFILVKKNEEEDLKKKLPSDILWKRAVPYEEFIDIEKELCKQIKNRPEIKAAPSPVEEAKKVFAEIDPVFAQAMEDKIEELRQSQQEVLARLESLLREAKLDRAVAREKREVIPSTLENQIKEILEKVEQREKITGFPDNPKIAFLRANFYYERGEYEKALELYDWAITLRPNFEGAWYNKGVVLDQLGKYGEAITCFNKATEIKPHYADAWYNKGVVLGKLKRWQEARQCYEEALKINPNDIRTIQNLSEALLILTDIEKALKRIDEGMSIAKKAREKAICRFLRISALTFKGEVKQASGETRQLIDYLRKLGEGFKVIKWDFSPLLPTLEERLSHQDKRKMFSLISLLKGEIAIKDFERNFEAF